MGERTSQTSLDDIDRHLSESIAEWNSDQRMSFFMQAFKAHRDVNPSDWDSKMNFWTRVVKECLVHCDRYRVLVPVSDLRERCLSRTRKEGDRRRQTSLGWDTVISELQKRNELVSLQEFRNVYDVDERQGMGTWLMENVVSKPAAWLWKWSTSGTKISISENASGNGRGRDAKHLLHDNTLLVVLFNVRPLAEKFANEVYETQVEHYDPLVCPSEIRNYFRQKNAKTFSLNDGEIDVLVNYIASNMNAAAISIKQGLGLKFFERGEKKRKVDDVELESDRAIIQLKEMLHVLEKQKEETELEMDRCTREIKRLMREKQNQRARFVLQRRKLLESALNKRLSSIQNVASIYHEIQTAKTDMQVFEALKSGGRTLQKHTQALKNMDVEDTLDSISDVLMDYSDIRSVMDMGMESMRDKDISEIDEEELMKELEALEISSDEEEADKKQAAEEDVAIKQHKTDKEKSPSKEEEKQAVEEDTEKSSGTSLYLVPSIDNIPQSQSVLQSELEIVEDLLAIDSNHDQAKKLRGDINLALKLIRLKKKRKAQDYITALKEKLDQLQEAAMEDGIDTSKAVQWMRWIELIEGELEELEKPAEEAATEKASEERKGVLA